MHVHLVGDLQDTLPLLDEICRQVYVDRKLCHEEGFTGINTFNSVFTSHERTNMHNQTVLHRF